MKKENITIINKLENLEIIQTRLDDISRVWELSDRLVYELNLVLEELVTNIIFYGYDDEKEHEIVIHLEKEGAILYIEIIDDGKAFNPVASTEPEDLDKPLEERKIGGLGIHFVKKLMDSISYKREHNRNIVILTRNIHKN